MHMQWDNAVIELLFCATRHTEEVPLQSALPMHIWLCTVSSKHLDLAKLTGKPYPFRAFCQHF